MPTPLPPEIILPGPGQRRGYLNPYTGTYSTSRSYAMRMQRGYARGLPQYEARGKPRFESQIRLRRSVEQTGETPWQRFNAGFEQRYGFSYSYWRSLRRRWINEINSRTSTGGQVIPSHISSVLSAWNTGWRDPNRPEFTTWQDWMENRLAERLNDIIEYQDLGDKSSGFQNWQFRSNVPPIELYWYH